MTDPTPRVRFTAPEGETVSVRVLPLGAGRIFTGERDDATTDTAARFPTFERGAVFQAAPETAAELEARGLVEIQP